MREYFSLTRVLLKDIGSAFEFKSGGKDRKWLGPFLWVVVGICMLPLVWLFYVMFQGLYTIFAPAGQLAYITGLLLNMTSIVIFIFSAFSAPAIFYFSKEVEYLLPLPLRPTQIIGAKFTVALLFEYLVALFVMVPLYAVYVAHLPAGTLTVMMLLTFITLPIMPLIYSTTLVMLLMRLSRFGRNRDRYNMMVSLLAVIFGFSISMFSQRLNNVNTQQIEDMITGNQAALLTLRSLFPNNIGAGDAIANGSVSGQLVSLLITAAALAVFFLLARVLYFKGVIGIGESSAPSRKMTRDQIRQGARRQSVFRSCLQKEFMLLFRSPTAFMNCVLMVFLMPVLLVMPIFMNLKNAGSVDLTQLLTVNFNHPPTVAFIMIGAAATGFVLSAMNLVTSTSISREGQQYIYLKYIPVDYRTQLNAKVASGLCVSLVGLAVLFILLEVFVKAPPLVLTGAFILTLPGTVFLNYVGLLIDLMKPKLTWDNEQRAVKQNMNVMIIMLIGFVLATVIGVAGALFLKTPLLAFVVLLLFTGVLAAAAYHFVLNMGEELMAKLNA